MLTRALLSVLLAAVPLAAQASPFSFDLLGPPHLFEVLAQLQDPAEAASRQLTLASVDLPAPVARRAMEAVFCAEADGMAVEKLLVVDMAASANQRRLWAFDLSTPNQPRLVLHDFVAHGAGSDRNGDGNADMFSNRPDSHMTSLGLYRVAERYHGKNGWSRRLDGLFDRFNGKARARAVVMHPSTYVSPGRVGRSQGCPAVSQAAMDRLEKAGLQNAVLWIDAPDQTLAQAVAECSQKRRGALMGEVLREALPAPMPWTLAYDSEAVNLAPSVNPRWPQWPDNLACRLTVLGSRRVDMAALRPNVFI